MSLKAFRGEDALQAHMCFRIVKTGFHRTKILEARGTSKMNKNLHNKILSQIYILSNF